MMIRTKPDTTELFLYGLIFLGYNYTTVAWQGNLTTTTVTLAKYNVDFNKTEKSYKTRHSSK